jgi:predicted NUDIX family phosphoesterase
MEQVLVIPSSEISPWMFSKLEKGISSDVNLLFEFDGIFNTNKMRFMNRDEAEKDENYKQLIPYCVLANHDGKVFAYQRTKKGGESRLHHHWSVGIGGHINPEDADSNASDWSYRRGMIRELKEETGIDLMALPANKRILSEIWRAVIYDSSNPVGRVHLGFVHLVYLPKQLTIQSPDPAIANGCWLSKEEVLSDLSRFENWSRLILEGDLLWTWLS